MTDIEYNPLSWIETLESFEKELVRRAIGSYHASDPTDVGRANDIFRTIKADIEKSVRKVIAQVETHYKLHKADLPRKRQRDDSA